MILITKAIHKSQIVILMTFDSTHKELLQKIRSLKFTKYSNTLYSWYLPYQKDAWAAFQALNIPFTIEDNGPTGIAKPNCGTTDIQISDAPPSTCIKQAADTPNISIKYSRPYFFIRGVLNSQKVSIIKKLGKAYWNPKYQNWVIPATIANLNVLHFELKFIDKCQLEIWAKQIAILTDPPKCTLYTSPQYLGQVIVQLSGEGVDVDFLYHIPERTYNNELKFWLIPNEDALITRTIDHYTSTGTQVVNRCASAFRPTKVNTSLCEYKNYLLSKTPSTIKTEATQYLNALIRERYSRNTIKEYHGKFVLFAAAFDPRSCSELSVEDVNQFLTKLSSKRVSDSLVNIYINAIKFYYLKVIYLPHFKIERIKRPRKGLLLPKVLSVLQVDGMLRATDNLKHTTLLFALYGHGIRLNEVLNLRMEDMLWDRNQIFIKGAKGKKDRYITMSQEFKAIVELYIHTYKPTMWVFEGQNQVDQYSDRSVQQVVKNAAKKAGIAQRVTPHTLRHCYATHLLDCGTQLPYIKELLGHKDIKTTMIYTHITTAIIDKVVSPLDLLKKNLEKN